MLSDNFELIEHLALKNKHIRGITECLPSDENGDMDEDTICEILYGISLENFNKLVSDLLPLCMYANSELTNRTYQGFADLSKNMFLVKREMEKK